MTFIIFYKYLITTFDQSPPHPLFTASYFSFSSKLVHTYPANLEKLAYDCSPFNTYFLYSAYSFDLNILQYIIPIDLLDFSFFTVTLSFNLFLLAIPMILELSLESVFAVVDMFFVGKLGENAIATVGLTESVITIVYSIAIGLSTAATAIVARRIGEKNPEAAAHAGAQSLIVALIVTLILSLIGVLFAKSILSVMGASQDVVKDGAIFTRIMFGGSLAIILLFLINGIFRGAGCGIGKLSCESGTIHSLRAHRCSIQSSAIRCTRQSNGR
jgi:uncharacterized membrane protein